MGKMKDFNKALDGVWKDKSIVVKDDKYLNIYIEKRNRDKNVGNKNVDSYKKIHIRKDRKTNFTVTKIKTISMIDRKTETKVFMKDLTIERMKDSRNVDVSQTDFTIFKN
ncbi:MAG: hypothetical protein HRT71_21225 [Flavobacteriales bacterium]|nr:hypothetical protein [Flavobacteriales bacterium]